MNGGNDEKEQDIDLSLINFYEHASELDFDGQGGTEFVRILLSLVSINHPPLVSSAMQLLLRHFGQHAEVTRVLKQIQLLVSNEDIDHYMQIKDAVDTLRLVVDSKAERVVQLRLLKKQHKTHRRSTSNMSDGDSSVASASQASQPSSPKFLRRQSSGSSLPVARFASEDGTPPRNSPENIPRLQSTVSASHFNLDNLEEPPPQFNMTVAAQSLRKLCNATFSSGASTPTGHGSTEMRVNKESQRLSRYLGAHVQVLSWLRHIRPLKKVDVSAVYKLSHTFLQQFCRNNDENQKLLHGEIQFILEEMRIHRYAADTILSIFGGNAHLCSLVSDTVITYFVNAIERHGRHVSYVRFLRSLVTVNDAPNRKNQDVVLNALAMADHNVLQLYNDDVSFQSLIKIMHSSEPADEGELAFHVNMIHLLAECSEGRNAFAQIKCQGMLTLEDVVRTIIHPSTVVEVKDAYVKFLTNVYIVAETDTRELGASPLLWTLIESFMKDLDIVHQNNFGESVKELTEYCAQTMTRAIQFILTNPTNPVRILPGSAQHKSFMEFFSALFRLSYCRWLHVRAKSALEAAVQAMYNAFLERRLPMNHTLGMEVPAYLSKRRVANKAINNFLENVRNKKGIISRRPSVDSHVRGLFFFMFLLTAM